MNLKGAIYWLCGPSFGRVVVSVGGWLFTGRWIEEGGQVATNVAGEAVEDITRDVQLRAQSLAEAKSALAEIQRLYAGLVAEHENYGRQAALAAQKNSDDDAAIALQAQLDVEDALTQAKGDVDGAEKAVQVAEEDYREAQKELAAYQRNLKSIEIQNKINEARSRIADIAQGSNKTLESARKQFDQAKTAVRRRGDTQQAYLELQTSETDQAMKRLEKGGKDSLIQQRLQALKAGGAPMQLPAQKVSETQER